jgi:hypothetical protein
MTVPPKAIQVSVVSPMTSGGQGVPADVDIDVCHDAEGFPRLRQSTVQARLRDSALEVAYTRPDLLPAARRLFGVARAHDNDRILSAGPAELPVEVRKRMVDAGLTPAEVLAAFTIELTTTAVGRDRAPKRGSRRDIRAVRTGVTLLSELTWLRPPQECDLLMLARVVLGVQQIGLGGGRGRGTVSCWLDGSRAGTCTLAGITSLEGP